MPYTKPVNGGAPDPVAPGESSFSIVDPASVGDPSSSNGPQTISGADRDDVAGSVAAAVAAAVSRYESHQADTHGLGSTIGTLMNLPTAEDRSQAAMHHDNS
jgi:hypothetical protein